MGAVGIGGNKGLSKVEELGDNCMSGTATTFWAGIQVVPLPHFRRESIKSRRVERYVWNGYYIQGTRSGWTR